MDATLERYEEKHDNECDSESELKDERDLLCRMFDGWMCCVFHAIWDLNKDYNPCAMIGLSVNWVRGK